MTMPDYDLLVVGAGPAGCLAAALSAEKGKKVLLIERNSRPARKILVTGKGRCNLTNLCTPEEFLQNVCHNGKFLYSAINRFPSEKTVELFESLGVPLKTERGRRVFPVSDRAMDIADALQRYVKRTGVILKEGRVRHLLFEGKELKGVITETGEEYRAKRVLISTGGMSYPKTGSTGDGYALAKEAGHNIISPRPSLVGIKTCEDFSQMAGLTLKNVTLRLFYNGSAKPIYKEQGEMLFTHEGISGPLALSASAYMDEAPNLYNMEIDFKPALSAEQLDARLLREIEENKNKSVSNMLSSLLPRAIIPMAMNRAHLPMSTKVNALTKEQRQSIAKVLKAFSVTPMELGNIEEAVITCGGVDIKEVDPRTMCSLLVPNLQFAGEVLNVDAKTGGYNLQIAFCTAAIAVDIKE